MTAIPATGTISNATETKGAAKAYFEQMQLIVQELVGGTSEQASTALVSHVLTIPDGKAVIIADTQAAASTDSITNIVYASSPDLRDGMVVGIRLTSAARTISFNNGGGSKGLSMRSGNYTLTTTNEILWFKYKTAIDLWEQIFPDLSTVVNQLIGNQVGISNFLVSSNAVTPTIPMFAINAASDLLAVNGIKTTNFPNGNGVILVTALSASTRPLVKNGVGIGGVGKTFHNDGLDVTLAPGQWIMYYQATGNWQEIARFGFNVGSTEMNCRAYLTSGNPAADTTNATNIYVGPYLGSVVNLPDTNGNSPTPFALSEIATAIPAAIFRIYDIFLYNNAGTPTVELDPWDGAGQTTGTITGVTAASPPVITATNTLSAGDFIGIAGIVGTIGTQVINQGLNGKVFKVASATGSTITLESNLNTIGLVYTSGGTFYKIPTTRSTGLTNSNGRYLRTGALNKVFIGTFMAGSQGTSARGDDSTSSRLVWNYFNRLKKATSFVNASGGSYTAVFYRPRNNTTQVGFGRAEYVVGIAEDPIDLRTSMIIQGSITGIIATSLLQINSCAPSGAPVAVTVSIPVVNQAQLVGQLSVLVAPSVGYSFVQAIELGGNGTFFQPDTGGSGSSFNGRF